MPDRCPKDGGFIGRSGCTHPNHVHSPRVQALLAVKTPRVIDVADANAMLNEGFYVDNPETGAAALRLGRRCILVEKEEKYCEVAARLLSQSLSTHLKSSTK